MKETRNFDQEIADLEAMKQSSYENYKLGKMSRFEFIENKKRLNGKLEELKQSQTQAEDVDETPINELTRELVGKYIESIILRGNEIEQINWK